MERFEIDPSWGLLRTLRSSVMPRGRGSASPRTVDLACITAGLEERPERIVEALSWGEDKGSVMRQFVRTIAATAVLIATALAVLIQSASAVPSYTRRYGLDCSSCHSMWGALTPAGLTFRLSGYRAIFGHDLVPIQESKDINIPGINAKIPPNLPLSFVTGFGYENRTEKRQGFDGTSGKQGASSLALEDASIFLTSPVGDRFSVFVEFPMYETRAWEFTPTGPSYGAADGRPGGANDVYRGFRHFQFSTEKPIFEVGKFFWNNLLGDTLARDSFNAAIGITHLPLPYSPGKVRLSVNQYPIYERRALDLISPIHPSLMGGTDGLFRLSEPQIQAELFGMIVPGGPVTASANRETLWFEYHAGVTNASNDQADNNRTKGGYGRFVGRWYNQSLGFFGFYTPDTYDDALRTNTTFVNVGNLGNCGVTATCAGGIYNPATPYATNAATALGVDGTASLAPWGIPLSLDNQYMWRKESNPTGYNTEFTWQGGFHQLNWFAMPNLVVYGRYDWVRGNRFNDVPMGGITFSDPREWDVVLGVQYALWENVKVIGEYRHHRFEDRAVGSGAATVTTPFATRIQSATITDDGFTTRLMMGF